MALRYINFSGNLSFSGTVAVDDGDSPGGGGDWWDADALVDIDFVNDRAWTASDGEVQIDTLVGSDPIVSSAYGTSTYDPEALSADGYTMQGDHLAFIGGAKTLLLGGATIRVEFKRVAASGSSAFYQYGADDASAALALDVDWNNAEVELYSWLGTYNKNITGVLGSDGSINAFAMTATSSRSEVSVNGSAADVESLSTDDWPASGYDVVFINLEAPSILRRIKIFDPLADATGLPALSTVS